MWKTTRRRRCYILIALAILLISCGAKEKDTKHVEELFEAIFFITEEDLENYSGNMVDDLENIIDERFAPHITTGYFDKFSKNRQCNFFIECIRESKTSTVEFEVEESQDKGNAYDVKGGGTLKDAGGEEHPYFFTAYVEVVEEEGEKLVSFVRLKME